MIGCVDVDSYTVERSLDGLFGPTVKHLCPDTSIVRVPGDENKLGRITAVGCLELQIHQAVTRLIFWQVTTEVLISFRPISLLLNDDGCLVLDLVDVVSKLFSLS